VFKNPEYWSRSLERLTAPGTAARPFAEKEVEGLNQAFRAETLAPVFTGHILAYLCQTGGQTDLIRHLNYLTNLGREDLKLPAYLQALGDRAKEFVDRIEKGDPILKTWDFVIGYMRIQVAVAEGARPDEVGPLQAQLETYLEYRNHYASPADYMQAKRVFNTALLEALQMGINGKFSAAGERLEAILGDIPHGVSLGQVEEALWKLREACRRPSIALDRGVNLVQEYERAYQRVVNFTLQKGS
jgi:hypothetical protein